LDYNSVAVIGKQFFCSFFHGVGLQKIIELVDTDCKKFESAILSELILNGGGKLNGADRWRVYGQNIEVIVRFSNLRSHVGKHRLIE
jgi:hypothetical protein